MKKNTAVPHATPRHATPRHATPRHATPRHATPQKPCSSGVKFHFAHTLARSYRSLLFLLAAGMFLFSCKDDKIEPSSEASLTSLTLTVGSTDYEVTFTDRQHTLRVGPLGTPIPATVGVKDIVLSPGATTDAKDRLSVTNNAVTLTVTAADGTTRKTYTVKLVFTTAGITSFTFEVPDNESMALDTADRKRIVGKIDQEAKTITFDRQSAYVYLDKLKATFEVSEAGAKVQVGGADQESGTTEQDFTLPVSYEVSAEGTETTTYTVTLLKSTMATIPDAQFRAKLKDFVPAAFTEDQLDITHNTVINNNDTLNIRKQTPKLTSLKGIEFFTALDTLKCSHNALTSLDVSRNTALTNLVCDFNDLISLNVSGNTALTSLSCDSNPLASLDVSENTALTVLSCFGNSLQSLDVSANTALTGLYCSHNALTSLDVRENTALTGLFCSGNDLASLDLSANTALGSLHCRDNNLQSLDVSGSTALTTLACDGNALTSLDVSANTALTYLWCFGNSLSSLDMTGVRSVSSVFGALNIGTGAGTANRLETLRVNTAVQDNTVIVTMKKNRGVDLTITTVDDAGEEDCANYTPAIDGGNCN